ncbi:winged helix-turn-helix domain-containing protein [Polymorphospora sp. NPDC051019]|uniref:AfsR/SARP family transcriptional regulator n=1 Tax=Polymorphospora sp. NPDC051019 TaxID=3155725 RepID=UPI003436BD56
MLRTLEIRDHEGTTVALPRQKQRVLLAYLLVHAGRVVSSDEIEYALWGERPPASARANLYS